MRKDTYRIGDGTFAFSPAVFDSLLGHGAKGAARMRELVVGRCEFLCEYQDEIDEVYHGLFEKRI